MFDEIIVDLFAGGGGASLGIEWALGRAVDVAVNHDPASIAMHSPNHPHTAHLCEDVRAVDPVIATGGRPVGLLWASPDCRHFSKAKGGKPVSKKIRGLAWVVIRWAAAVRPRVICLENVEEFQTWGPLGADGRPCPKRKGKTFRSWTGQLRKLGYDVQWRELRACDYGAPTTRKRLFLVARCDGKPIVWPAPTHGKGTRRPWRTAAQCIDWSIPCPSIFDRQKPLAEKTQRRIAMGLKRYVLDNPRPFIVNVQHGNDEFRGQSIDQPLGTVTKKHGYGVVMPFLAKHYGGVVGHGVDRPIGTVTSVDHHSLVMPFLEKFYGTAAGASVTAPSPTVTAGAAGGHPAVVPILVTIDHTGSVGKCAQQATAPASTITQENRHALVAAFMVKYFGTAVGHGMNEPAHTVTSHDRMGLVTVTIQGEPYVIVDIGLRMLSPRELSRAQGFPDSYILTGTKSNQVARIGNSVCPPVAEAIVRANVPEMARRGFRVRRSGFSGKKVAL